MSTRARHLNIAGDEVGAITPAVGIAQFLAWLSTKRGRSGRITSAQTVRAYTSALPIAFAGIGVLDELDDEFGRNLVRTNIRTAWGASAPSTFNARRAAVASALDYFAEHAWIDDAAAVLAGLDREPQPKPDGLRVRDRSRIDALIADRRHRLEDRTLWAMLYASAARAEEVLSLDIDDLDRPNRRARVIRKGGKHDELMYDIRTARLLGQLLAGRTRGPVFLSTRVVRDGTVDNRDVDPVTGRRRMGYRTVERRLDAATGGWDPHDLRHSRLTHAGEDGATEADLMLLSGHEDRRTLQRYLHPSKEGAHRRLDDIDARRGTWTPSAADLAERIDRAAQRHAAARLRVDARPTPDVAVYDQLLTRPRND
ncbi:site-specific integrase (plasmid) [Nocardia farcinica]|uniref:tyrosine-type recombinase/integrase n=1 Tax=Nocardia farcinica TaxID=37329 RepID=UPI0018948098|nr:site-specific integrase [Nocardia farcinica]MBF6284493.1 site-specific integrase [Nocardia farcinica]